MEKEIKKGFKAFVKDENYLYDRYGGKYHEGDVLHVYGSIKFSVHGFHFCKNLEDTLRYVDAFHDDIAIAKVLGFGKINEYRDEYYEYGEMYSASDLQILKILSRDEIIEEEINNSYNIKRFIEGYNLTLEELLKILESFKDNKTVRTSSLIHGISYMVNDFNSLISNMNITDEEIGFVLKYLQFANISDEEKEMIREDLGNALIKGKTRVRK